MSDVAAIQERNIRVEAEKAWETSWTRRVIITLGTLLLKPEFLHGSTSGWQSLIIGVKVMTRNCNLSKIVQALCSSSSSTNSLNGGQQERNEDTDNGNDHKQFD